MRKRGLLITSFFLAASSVAIACSFTMAGYTASRSFDPQINVKRLIYVDIDQCSNWKSDSPKFACYVWDTTGTNVACFVADAMMDVVTTNTTFRIAIPSGYDRCLFVRMNPAESIPSFDYDGHKCWGQTADLWIGKDTSEGEGTNNCFYVKSNANNKAATGNWGTIPETYTYSYTES